MFLLEFRFWGLGVCTKLGIQGLRFRRDAKTNSFCGSTLPIGSMAVLLGGSYLESYKVIPKKELLWSLWVCGTELGISGLSGYYGGALIVRIGFSGRLYYITIFRIRNPYKRNYR